jgi:hypothetical protein
LSAEAVSYLSKNRAVSALISTIGSQSSPSGLFCAKLSFTSMMRARFSARSM